MSASTPTTQDAAAALVVAYKSKHAGAEPPPMAIVLPLAQILGAEGSLTHYFLGTNNLGAMHATDRFARIHAADRGYGMVAFLDHAPGPVAYIARMSVYPSLSNGARALLDLIERMVALSTVSSAAEYATELYAHGYFEGMAAPATPAVERPAALASGNWTDADRANIAAYAGLISASEPAARAAYDALPSYTGNPSAVTSGPPFASLTDRLTPSTAYAPHTLEHARALLGAAASSPAPGGVTLSDCLSTPTGDGVWLFGAPALGTAIADKIDAALRTKVAAGFAAAAAVLAAAALGSAASPRWPALLTEAIS